MNLNELKYTISKNKRIIQIIIIVLALIITILFVFTRVIENNKNKLYDTEVDVTKESSFEIPRSNDSLYELLRLQKINDKIFFTLQGDNLVAKYNDKEVYVKTVDKYECIVINKEIEDEEPSEIISYAEFKDNKEDVETLIEIVTSKIVDQTKEPSHKVKMVKDENGDIKLNIE